MCSVVPETMYDKGLPQNTSGGTFETILDVLKQDGAASAHYPVLNAKFDTLAETVKRHEKDDVADREDYEAAVDKVRSAFDDVIEEETEGSPWNPFD